MAHVYKCPDCEFSAMTKRELNEHIKFTHATEKIPDLSAFVGTDWLQARPDHKIALYHITGVSGTRFNCSRVIYDRESFAIAEYAVTSIGYQLVPGAGPSKKVQAMKPAPKGHYDDVIKKMVLQIKPRRNICRTSRKQN